MKPFSLLLMPGLLCILSCTKEQGNDIAISTIMVHNQMLSEMQESINYQIDLSFKAITVWEDQPRYENNLHDLKNCQLIQFLVESYVTNFKARTTPINGKELNEIKELMIRETELSKGYNFKLHHVDDSLNNVSSIDPVIAENQIRMLGIDLCYYLKAQFEISNATDRPVAIFKLNDTQYFIDIHYWRLFQETPVCNLTGIQQNGRELDDSEFKIVKSGQQTGILITTKSPEKLKKGELTIVYNCSYHSPTGKKFVNDSLRLTGMIVE